MELLIEPCDILVRPRSNREYGLLMSYFKRKKVRSYALSRGATEDIGLAESMRDVDLSDTVSREKIMSTLHA
jgi:hypothetical protein